MWRHYVYIHRKKDGSPFYVGKGSARVRCKSQTFERAYERASRGQHWRNVVGAHGLIVEVVMCCQTDLEAQDQERWLIATLGRADLGRGPLINKTDGGDGHAGIMAGPALRAKRSINASGKRSVSWVKSIRAARKDGGNGGVVKHGDTLPESWRRNLARAKMGQKNPYFGKPSPVSKKVKNIVTGEVYDSIARAAAATGINAKTLYQYLDGTRVNQSHLVRV